jgi:hypothetical protein
MAAKLTRLTHKVAIQLHLVTESCTICSSRSRRPVRKILDTPSYLAFVFMLVLSSAYITHLPTCLSICLSVCLSVGLSACLSVCLIPNNVFQIFLLSVVGDLAVKIFLMTIEAECSSPSQQKLVIGYYPETVPSSPYFHNCSSYLRLGFPNGTSQPKYFIHFFFLHATYMTIPSYPNKINA